MFPIPNSALRILAEHGYARQAADPFNCNWLELPLRLNMKRSRYSYYEFRYFSQSRLKPTVEPDIIFGHLYPRADQVWATYLHSFYRSEKLSRSTTTSRCLYFVSFVDLSALHIPIAIRFHMTAVNGG